MIKSLVQLSVLVVMAASALGQVPMPGGDKASPPEGPLLRPPANFAKWEIVSTPAKATETKAKPARRAKGGQPSAASRSQTTVTTKTGRLIHEENADSTARNAMETWYEGTMQYSKASGDSLWYGIDGRTSASTNTNAKATSDANYHPLPAIGYRDVECVTEENYAGTLPHNKRPCLVFVPVGAGTLNLADSKRASKQLEKLDTVVFVDAETRLPVEVRTRGEKRVFQFDPPPKQMQTLPADLLAQIKKGDDARTRLNQPAPRPY